MEGTTNTDSRKSDHSDKDETAQPLIANNVAPPPSRKKSKAPSLSTALESGGSNTTPKRPQQQKQRGRHSHFELPRNYNGGTNPSDSVDTNMERYLDDQYSRWTVHGPGGLLSPPPAIPTTFNKEPNYVRRLSVSLAPDQGVGACIGGGGEMHDAKLLW